MIIHIKQTQTNSEYFYFPTPWIQIKEYFPSVIFILTMSFYNSNIYSKTINKTHKEKLLLYLKHDKQNTYSRSHLDDSLMKWILSCFLFKRVLVP